MVHFEDFLNGVDIGSCPQVQPKVIPVGCAHDLLKGRKMNYVNNLIIPEEAFYIKQALHTSNYPKHRQTSTLPPETAF